MLQSTKTWADFHDHADKKAEELQEAGHDPKSVYVTHIESGRVACLTLVNAADKLTRGAHRLAKTAEINKYKRDLETRREEIEKQRLLDRPVVGVIDPRDLAQSAEQQPKGDQKPKG